MSTNFSISFLAFQLITTLWIRIFWKIFWLSKNSENCTNYFNFLQFLAKIRLFSPIFGEIWVNKLSIFVRNFCPKVRNFGNFLSEIFCPKFFVINVVRFFSVPYPFQAKKLRLSETSDK